MALTFLSWKEGGKTRVSPRVIGQAAGDERVRRDDGPPHEQLVGTRHSGEEAEQE